MKKLILLTTAILFSCAKPVPVPEKVYYYYYPVSQPSYNSYQAPTANYYSNSNPYQSYDQDYYYVPPKNYVAPNYAAPNQSQSATKMPNISY